MGKPRFGRFSDKRYALPFGRYVGSSEVEPPADEVLVGRESQRAYLIDLLISTGRRGAYLVTGQRGVGKTSFVQHCICEYEASVFGRFLRGNLGRSFWDRIFVLLFWLAILLGALLTSEALQIFVVSREWNALRWVILAPIGIILLYPCVYAKVVLEIVQQATQDLAPPPKRRWPTGVFAAAAVILLCAFFWFVPGFEEPVSAISFLIPITGGMYLLVQTVSFVPPEAQTGRTRSLISWGLAIVFILVICRVSLLCREELLRFKDIFAAQLGLGLILLGSGCMFRGAHQRVCEEIIESRCHGDKTHQKIRESFIAAMSSGTRWYVAVGIALAAFGAVLYYALRLSMAGPVLLLSIALLLWRFRQDEGERKRKDGEEKRPAGQDEIREPARFRPRPGWVLSIKAAASVVVALQLAHPFVSRVFSQISEFMRPLISAVLSDLSELVRPFSSVVFSGFPKLAHSGTEICDLAEIRSLCALTLESRALHQIGTPTTPLFSTSTQEVWWLLGALTLLIIFQFIEYEWIIRPFIRSREEYIFAGSSLAPWDDWENDKISAQDRRRVHLSLAELTLPWVVFRSWLPVIPISVNLGFDRLDHRQVIQAMLVGLRERYKKTFLAWNSGFANLGRFLGLLSLLSLVTLTTSSADSSLHQSWSESLKEGFGSPTWASILNNDLFFREIPQGQPTDLLLFHLLPSERRVGSNPYLHFSVYHALVLTAFFLLGQWLLHRLPILPFKENLRRIEDMLDSLSARTRVTSRSYLWGPARWAHSIFSDERVRETEREPVDPRTVELAFLQILEDIQKGGFRLPGAARDHLTLPAPEVTFVFDELDKLGTRADVVSETRAPSSPEQVRQMLYSERERSLKIRALLSDLKNIIASAPARFIFVGGRDLHDEWLADHTSRQPLLSSIFNTEVYLPSLLTDHAQHPPSEETRLHQQVKLYIEHQYERALYLSRRSVRKRWLPPFGLSNEATSPERFASTEPSTALPPVFDCETGFPLTSEGTALIRDFTLFLTHRSMGNPKKLRDLLLSFIRPAGREIDPKIRWDAAPCRHIISFSDTDIFRIQLMVDIYQHLCLAFETKMVHRDDKFAISIFFMTDFLFKFHRRAFSWSNLERVDDLAHIHRLPDLRDVQEEIVDHFSERFLHRVFNGMYSFRFRSDIALEVEYLSRRSATEMAAFNFTLDESQSLKAEYAAALKSSEGGNPDLVAALGELYEFDQDFERARYQYRMAIDLMDAELSKSIEPANPVLTQKLGTPVLSILDATHSEYARLFVPWGVARLRLMLQIGMTYEHERDKERAETEYRSARTLARALVRAYVDRVGRGEEPLSDPIQNQRKQRLHTLKHLNIVFQPIFAEAWISEKFVGSIDTSTSLVEKALWEIRRSLPFVRDPKLPNVAKTEVFRSHANFALTIAQLHNKAGDLYFFKGRQPTTTLKIQEILRSLSTSKQVSDRSTEGYLLRAHYHYAVGLHELRRYVHHRVARSQFWLSIARDQTQTLLADALPDFLFRAAGGGVSDMAEATLARVSLFELLNRLKRNSVEWQEKDIPDLKEYFLKWLGINEGTDKSRLANWFGWWMDYSSYDNDIKDLIDFLGPDSADSRLLMSLKLCLVGAELLEDGGYPEDAGRELLQVCETVTRYIWWGHTVETLCRWFPVQTSLWDGHGPADPPLLIDDIFTGSKSAILFWNQLVDMAIAALERADRLFRQSRSQNAGETNAETYIVGTIIPTEAATLLCSLGIAGRGLLPPQKVTDLRKLLLAWTREPTYDFSDALRRLLQRHRYPMINRLNGLKILIDDLVLREVPFISAEEDFDQAILWTEELLDLNTQFDAPLHFTPIHSGVTCALVWLWASQDLLEKDMSSVLRIYRAANNDLDRSEEMYTMRRAYYEAISGLYYLYDDFNDRQIHYNHAIQMAGSELTAILKHLVERSRPA